MRKSTIVVTAVLVAGTGVGIWAVLRPSSPKVAGPEVSGAVKARGDVAAVAPAPVPPAPAPRRLELPPEPAPPAAGTPAARTYFGAVVQGQENGLAAVRKALADARATSGPGSADEAYVRNLEGIERGYVERLARHRGKAPREP